MRFITADGEERSELRIPRNIEFDGDIKTRELLYGRVLLPAADTSPPGLAGRDKPDQYTFMQVLPQD